MALGLLLFGASPVASAVAVGLWGFAFGALPVGFQTWMVRVAPDEAEVAGGLLVAAFQVAIASGAIFGGLLVDGFGALGAIGYAAVATLLGAPRRARVWARRAPSGSRPAAPPRPLSRLMIGSRSGA